MLNRILITSVGGGLAAELIKNIKKKSKFKHLKIFGADMNDNNVAKFFVDKFFVVPDPLNQNYVNKLTNIIKKIILT